MSALFVLLDSETKEIRFDSGRASWATAMLAFGALFTYTNVQAISVPRPLRWQAAADLTGPCTTGRFHMCANPRSEEAPVNHFDFLDFSTLLGSFGVPAVYKPFVLFVVPCCVCSLCLAWSVMKEERREQRGANERTPLV